MDSRHLLTGCLCLLLLAAVPGCSVRGMAVDALAEALAGAGDVYAADEDPELVREALPFALKTIETLLAERPHHEGLLLAAASGFTRYSYAFVETDALLLPPAEFERARELRGRAVGLYLRGRNYGLRGLERRHPGIGERLRAAPRAALAPMRRDDVPLLYWTAAAWGAAISAARDRPELVADLPAVEAMLARALALDESFERGALHEARIALAALPDHMGGPSAEEARGHFERAVELSGGKAAGPYLGLAESVALPAQDRGEFERLLEEALAIDPDAEPSLRLANRITQRRARALLDRADELFLNDFDLDEETLE